ncbi:hypothetical protein ASC95_15555 [Pelomonas sp. Root1217]|uniref:hypothetical protein n=1 Tax=Pelomonas sp. Root1217 TaxID=1736430 RepID=UPI00070C295D|nr:hypothetical protein [Pelomonas sp. Root1217]KQV50762.1 hypothetical protein ASC95_15555 [Pelomonas sp. Root1217]
MLRNLLLIAALAVGMIGLGARLAGHHDAAPFAIWGCVIAAAVLLERWRYRSRDATPHGNWQKTEERFVDPESGKTMLVFYNPQTGGRRYEQDPHA